jgi:hypothetical protein
VHACLGEARERCIRLLGVVHGARDDDGGRAVLQQVEARRDLRDVLEQVLHRPGNAVTLRLAGHDHGVEGREMLDERGVALAERLAARPALDLGPERRIVLRERARALHLEPRLAVPRRGVEEKRLLDRAHERVADAAEERVERPDRERVLPSAGERLDVRAQVLRRRLLVEAERRGGVRAHAPTPARHVVERHERIRVGVVAICVDEERRVEDLERLVRVERDDGLRDDAEVAVEEGAEAPRVLHGARTRSSRDEELEPRRAERVLHVYEQETGANAVLRCTRDLVLLRPADRVTEASLVVDLPHLPHAIEVDVRGQG